MLDIDQIASFYPEQARSFRKNILREYIQYKILEAIFTSPFAGGLSFMGGTAIRIVHGGMRFSEDLDFDNRSLDEQSFQKLSNLIVKRLRMEGYELEAKNALKQAFRSSLRFSGILFETGVSRHRDEVLTIQIDAEPQNFSYTPQEFIVNKFDVFTRVHAVPADILLAQKITCIFTRKRAMGRDFFDIVFLMAKTAPNLSYIEKKLAITSGNALKEKILSRCKDLNFQSLSREVAPFLTNPADSIRVASFPDYIASVKL